MGKRILSAIMAFALALTITGCGGQVSVATMRIQPADLTANESKIVELTRTDSQSLQIFDYHLDNDLQSVSIVCYQLDDTGKWTTKFGPSSFAMEKPDGRLVISFDDINNGMKIAIQDDKSTVGSEIDPGQITQEEEGMGRFTSYSDVVDIQYDKEIPLAMQVFSAGGNMSSGELEGFYNPEKLLASGYDAVFVVVVEFSKDSLEPGA